MKISIITVVYNNADTIEDTVRSVLGQTYTDIEYIVVDGASTDSTMAVIDRYRNQISKVVSEPDNGIYDAMNKGISLATGDVIGLLNADDIYAHERVLQKVADTFSDETIDASYADLVYVERRDMSKVVRYWKSRDYEPGLFLKGWMLAHPTFFVRTRVYEKFGKFDLAYRIQSDFELVMRFLEIYRIRTIYIPELFVRMRMGGVSNKGLMNVIKGNIESYKACKKHHLPIGMLFPIRKVLSRLPQFVLHRIQ